MRYKMVVFDMDGTFIDSRPFHARIFAEFFARYWRDVGYETCYQAVGATVREVFEAAGIPEERQGEFYDLLDEFYDSGGREFVSITRLAEGFAPLISWIREQGAKICVVTNSLNRVVGRILEHHHIADGFDDIVGADRHSRDKAARCLGLQQKHGIRPEEILFVGDAESDMLLSNRMGYDACFAKTPIAWYRDSAYIERELKPRFIVGDYAQLLEILQKV